MNARGVNILPVIGFIILILVLFTGLIISRKAELNDGAGTDMFGSIESKEKIIKTNTVDESRELFIQGGDIISVDAASTNVNIHTHTQDSVKAHLYGEVKTTGENMVPYLELVENGQTVAVKVKYPQGVNKSFAFYSDNLRLDVTIPESWMNKLDIRTVSGDISAQKLSGTDVVLKSSSGDIKIQDITGNYITTETVSGNINVDKLSGEDGFFKSSSGNLSIGEAVFSDKVEAKTISGKCRIDKLECKEGKFEASSGDIEAKDVIAGKVKSEAVSGTIIIKMRNGSVDLKTSSGNIRAEFEDSFDAIEAKSVSGDISLTLPSDSDFSVNVKTVTGNIKCNDFPVKITSSSDKSLVGNVGSGRSEVNVNTTSGNVLIRK